MPEVSFHTMRHCGQSWLAQAGVSAELRARLGGWSVRGLGAMDGYTHLFIEDLRPASEKLAEQWKAGTAVREAEKQAEEAAFLPLRAHFRHSAQNCPAEACVTS